MADLAINQLGNYAAPLLATNVFPVVQLPGASPIAAKQAPLSALLSDIVQKTNNATGWSLAGGTANRTLTLTSNCTIDQNLQTSADVVFHDATLTSLLLTAATSLHTGTIASIATLAQNTLFTLPEPGVSSTNFVIGNATSAQVITNTGAAPGVSYIGNMNWNVYGQIEAKDITNTNYHLTYGVSSANNAAAIFAGNAGVGYIPLLLDAPGGAYVGVGSPGNGSFINFIPRTTPATPVTSANLYSKTVAGLTSVFTLDSAGTETKLGASAVSSVFGRTGAVVAVNTDYSSVTDFTVTDLKATGLTGATAASRYVGATTSGAPVSGTFVIGDYVIDQTGQIWVCTVAGSPGTFVQTGGGTNYWQQSGGILSPIAIGNILRNTGHIETTNGNIRAGNGGAGNSGNLVSFASDASSLTFNCAANASPIANILSNASTGQISNWVLPDPGTGASTNIIIANSAGTQTIATGSLALTLGNVTAKALVSSGLTGATAASRYAGATAGGAPVSGTFAIGDFVIDQTGSIWICTTAGSPGTFTQLGSSTNYWSVFSDILFVSASTTYTKIHLGATDTSTLALVSNPTAGAFTTTLQNASMGQSTTFTLTDPGVASVNLLASDSAGKIVRTASANGGPVLPLTTAPVTVNFTAFPTAIDGVAISWKETTSGVPITVKEMSRTSSSVTFEIYNLSATTATGTVTVSAIVTGH